MGIEVGVRILELLTLREKITTRFKNVIALLTFVANSVWKYLFGHSAVLLRGKEDSSEFMLNDKEFQITKYISMPKVCLNEYIMGVMELRWT
ncbi:hypothetical protein BEWA_024190 [Theileria equi strain WA]|uniref:Uncharacterized protein n=1 Tax=Theileria equi strain WA TaxID=1537102 RepID=L0AVJ5_THEEQ|nr:hypothetical protein BEWA_024190 [Theileria equi strain WA]AFZ79570.1 hypothetical protein BEWA_024190 [Theileria equi strain WA]|eukprot:XP_004829236.1 hypothetical protein BEWA_024190 [Theileria equi strain WA]